MRLFEIKEKLKREEWVLPPFQREFVWSDEKNITEFIDSVFQDWPIGSIILWKPDPNDSAIIKKRNLQIQSTGKPKYLQEYILDGQQRITTLLRVLNNESFKFRDANKKMCYDFQSQEFVFVDYKNKKSDELKTNLILIGDILNKSSSDLKQNIQIKKLNYDFHDRISSIKNLEKYDVNVQYPGKPISLDDALELFIRLNTGGKQLPSVDLALAYISLLWDDSREEFTSFKKSIEPTGFRFDLDFFVRCLSAVSLKQSITKKLIRSFNSKNIKEDWEQTKEGITKTIDFLKGTLNLDSNLFLDAENTLVPIVLLFSKKEHSTLNKMDLLGYWFFISYINQRFSGQSTTVLNKDIKTILESKEPIDKLIDNLKEDRSIFSLKPNDIKGSQFKFILYSLFRTLKTRDFVSGFGIDSLAANKSNRLDFHHIFANSILKKSEFRDKKEDIANKTFLTNKANKKLSASDPTYLLEYPKELLRAHLIPEDESAWKLEKYETFLAQRKELISEKLDEFLNNLKRSLV